MSAADEGLAAVLAMDRGRLVATWTDRFGHAPLRHTSVKLMRSVLAWEEQADRHGGHSKQVERLLRDRAQQLRKARVTKAARITSAAKKGRTAAAAEGKGQGKALPTASSPSATAPASAPLLRPGVQLMREWNGRTYRVEVTEDGFAMDGRTYASLTAIARRITGAHWSGPRFFGLTGRRKRSTSGKGECKRDGRVARARQTGDAPMTGDASPTGETSA